jgi:hypothetical protein
MINAAGGRNVLQIAIPQEKFGFIQINFDSGDGEHFVFQHNISFNFVSSFASKLPFAQNLQAVDSMARTEAEDDQQLLMSLSGVVKRKGTRQGLWHKRFLTITGTRLYFVFF